MFKFSIIVPVYNVEKYIKDCLNSLLKQSYKNYEVIIVNDGSPDNSEQIIKKFLKDSRFKYFKKENGGLSDARNFGVQKAKGDYILFVDSDDYINKNCLKFIDSELKKIKEVEIVKFNFTYVDENKKIINNNYFNIKEGIFEAHEFLNISLNTKIPFEMAWLYAYNRKWWIEKKFEYPVGKIHEDLALTPLVLYKAKKIIVINKYLYFYRQTFNSITRHNNEEKTKKSADDVLSHFMFYVNIFPNYLKDSVQRKILNHLFTAVLFRTSFCNENKRKKVIKLIKEKKFFKYILKDTFKNKIRYLLIKYLPNLSFYLINR